MDGVVTDLSGESGIELGVDEDERDPRHFVGAVFSPSVDRPLIWMTTSPGWQRTSESSSISQSEPSSMIP